uniref:ACB domain-containing protein n=1 Tax=Globodera pallida TaxID=36090 RepID=A0A183CJG5_GLOPA
MFRHSRSFKLTFTFGLILFAMAIYNVHGFRCKRAFKDESKAKTDILGTAIKPEQFGDALLMLRLYKNARAQFLKLKDSSANALWEKMELKCRTNTWTVPFQSKMSSRRQFLLYLQLHIRNHAKQNRH